jgi:hypothetical protein
MQATQDAMPAPGQQLIEARYADMLHARQALTALEWAGVEPVGIELKGPESETPYYREETLVRDVNVSKAMLHRIVHHVLLLTPILGFAGGVAGLVGGRVAGLSDYDAWLTCGLGALLGGLVGSYLGAFIGGASALRVDEAAESRFEFDVRDHEPAVLRVTVSTEASAARAVTIMRAKEPVTLHRRFAAAGPGSAA